MKLRPQEIEVIDDQLHCLLYLNCLYYRSLEAQLGNFIMVRLWDQSGGEFLGKLEDTVEKINSDET